MAKTVNFNFSLSQEQAETLIDCIRNEALELKDHINDSVPGSLNKWRSDRVVYLEEIINIITKRV